VDRYDDVVVSNFLMLIWCCWCVRNNVLQAGEKISVVGSVSFLTRYIDALYLVRQQQSGDDIKGKQKCLPEREGNQRAAKDCVSAKKWTPPVGDDIKINVDGAFIQETGRAAVGVIIRNSRGHHLLSAWKLVKHCRDAEEAEGWACLEGIRLALRWPDKQIILEADCASVIGKLQTGCEDKSVITPIIRDILQETCLLLGVTFKKIRREQNKVAHSLAHLAIRSNECQVSLSNPPECVKNLICNEVT
jgi:ribonuclease HI